MWNFDAFELVEELPSGKYAYDMVWVDEWRGGKVRSRLCVRQFKAEGHRDDFFAGTPDTFFIKYSLAKATSCKNVLDINQEFKRDPKATKIGTKWDVTNTSTKTKPLIKARLVGKEFADDTKKGELFAGMLGLPALRYFVSKLATNKCGEERKGVATEDPRSQLDGVESL